MAASMGMMSVALLICSSSCCRVMVVVVVVVMVVFGCSPVCECSVVVWRLWLWLLMIECGALRVSFG